MRHAVGVFCADIRELNMCTDIHLQLSRKGRSVNMRRNLAVIIGKLAEMNDPEELQRVRRRSPRAGGTRRSRS
jgi:hypothetical protein